MVCEWLIPMNEQILFLELNEVNFEYLTGYAQRGLLPNFAAFLDRHGYAETTSETDYDHLEPWIQWVTAHTGLTYAEHGVFRLGDIVEHDFEQIWERLAAKGLRVGAISPMNANCPSNDIAFFLPDPWTPTGLVADLMTRRMFGAVVQAVNDNAESKLTLASAINLAVGGAKSASPGNYRQYASYLMAASKKPWQKSIFLDLLLSDIFAASVVNYLVKKGVAPERLEAVGHGDTKPIEDNGTKKGQAQNRRVEFNIVNE